MIRQASQLQAVYDESYKSYEEAVRTLNKLQSNRATIEKIVKSRDTLKYKSIPNTLKYLASVGIGPTELKSLSVIHVSGTKGKGSTCAFTESILRHHGYKTGFFSSPHLVEVRERIRVNGEPISYKQFTNYFWEVYNPLFKNCDDTLGMPAYFNFLTIMSIHAFLKEKVDVAVIEVGIGGEYDFTNVFPSPVVCGVTALGFDHTNILGSTIQSIAWHKAGIFKPAAIAFTVPQQSEAMGVLSKRAEERDTSLFVVPSILSAYCSYSQEPTLPLESTHQEDFVDAGSGNPLKLGIHGHAQFWNASLALNLAQAWIECQQHKSVDSESESNNNTQAYVVGSGSLSSCASDSSLTSDGSFLSDIMTPPLRESNKALPTVTPFPLRPAHLAGLRRTVWPGRSQTIKLHSELTLYLDGAHTLESLNFCCSWFMEESLKAEINRDGFTGAVKNESFSKVLIFNLTGDRDPVPLLSCLNQVDFDFAIFCPNVTRSRSISNSIDQTHTLSTDSLNKKVCLQNLEAWNSLRGQPNSCLNTVYLESIADALNFVNLHHDEPIFFGNKEVIRPDWLNNQIHVLATGSLYLIGGILKLVDPDLSGLLLN